MNCSDYEEIKIATLGNVSAGKSTLLGVLTKNTLDNGRGFARKNICKYPHEDKSGKTSSIGHHYSVYKKNSTIYKSITFLDLAGHEKYLKTTLSGINGTLCDYVMLIIAANMGVSSMTKEHFNIAIMLNKPIIIVITKLDICPEHILDNTISDIRNILSSKFVGEKKPWFIESENESIKSSEIISKKNIYPIFKISNVTGINLDNLKIFIKNLNTPINWRKYDSEPPLFLIEDSYQITGIGCVVTGTMKKGTITLNQKLWIGPFNDKFKQVIIKSIHGNVQNSLHNLSSGYSGAFAIKTAVYILLHFCFGCGWFWLRIFLVFS